MSFVVEKKVLYEIFTKAFPVIPVKSSLQILSNFKIIVHDNILEVFATDLDQSIRICGPVLAEEQFELTVNARKIFEVVRELADGKVTISCEDNVLIIKSEDSFECRIAGGDTRDFPQFPEIVDARTINVNTGNLKEMIQKSSFAVSKDETRACLCGILWEISKKRMGMVATDGHRLGSSFFNGDFEIESKTSCIVSPKTLIHLTRIQPPEETQKNITVSIAEKYIQFSNETVTLCSKLIEGPYPDYEKVIPKNNTKKIVIDKNILVEAVRRVSVLSNQKTHLVKFNFVKKTLEIMVLNRDIGGEARQTIAVEYDGDEHTVGFNGAYLSEILSIAATQKVRMEMNTAISACLLFPVREDAVSEDLFLIMPLRIMEE